MPDSQQLPTAGAPPQLRGPHQVPLHVSPPSPAFPVVTNNIPAPYAPRPARVSPLAVTRIRDGAEHLDGSRSASRVQLEAASPRTLQSRGRDERLARRPSDRSTGQDTSAPLRQPPYNPRKRRREHDMMEQPRRASGKRIARSPARSPEPYIKPEPVSPPPLSNEPPRRLILRNDGKLTSKSCA